jgi:hypothetical protein
MRAVRFVALILLAGLIAAGASLAVIGSGRESTFTAQATLLEHTWQQDIAVGVPASSLAPLRAELQADRPHGGVWSAVWWTEDGSGLITRLRRGTAAAYVTAMAEQRATASLALDTWRQAVGADHEYLAADPLAVQNATFDLDIATTPDEYSALAAQWRSQLGTIRAQVDAAQQAATLAADVTSAGGPGGLLDQAATAVSQAEADDLDPGTVPALEADMRAQLSASNGAVVTLVADQLYEGLQQLNQLITMNTQMNASIRSLYLTAVQAEAEGVPGADGLMSQYQTVDQGLMAGTTYDQIDAVQQQFSGLQATLASDLSADQCGHDTGPGKAITLSLTYQEMVMYDNGCVVNATPVTTGRPSAPTNPGDFTIFDKVSPCLMHSPWPPGSPLWYPDTVVQWAMEFQDGGYFIHDAYWEPVNSYGPGSEYVVWNDTASRGCVQVPTPMMQWLYSWTPMGTPVTVTA